MLGSQQGANFFPNRTPLFLSGRLWELHHFQKAIGFLLDLFPLNHHFFAPSSTSTTSTSAMSLHHNGQVLPCVPKLLQGELVAINTEQCWKGPCLDFLYPASPDTATGRRRLPCRQRSSPSDRSSRGGGQGDDDPQSLPQCRCGTQQNGLPGRRDESSSPSPWPSPIQVASPWPSSALPWIHMHPNLTVTHVQHVVEHGHLGLRGAWNQFGGLHWDCPVIRYLFCDMQVKLALGNLCQERWGVGPQLVLNQVQLGLDVLTPSSM